MTYKNYILDLIFIMRILGTFTAAEQSALIQLIGHFDWRLSLITEEKVKADFADRLGLTIHIADYQRHEELLQAVSDNLTITEECYHEMDIIRLRIVSIASLCYIPYLYQNFHPKDISLELRKILEFSLEALDWLCVTIEKEKVLTVESQYNGSDATANGIGEAEALSAKQMVSNIIIGFDDYHNYKNGENYNFSRVLYSPDENYARLHETHILIRSFQMYCSEGLSCLEIIAKGYYTLLAKSVLYKEILKPDLSGLSSSMEDYMELIARTIYLYTAYDCVKRQDPDTALLDKMSFNLSKAGVDTYELDVQAETISEVYLQYYKELECGTKSLSEIPADYIDELLVQVAIQHSINNFSSVPSDLQTDLMCRNAIAYDPMFFKYIAAGLVSEELCILAVRSNGLALEYIPEIFKNALVCGEAVLENGLAISFVPDGNLTKELALSAVSNNYGAYFSVPDEYRDVEMMMIALNQHPGIYKQFPSDLRQNSSASLFVLSVEPMLAAYIPDRLLSDKDFMENASHIKNGWQYYLSKK